MMNISKKVLAFALFGAMTSATDPCVEGVNEGNMAYKDTYVVEIESPDIKSVFSATSMLPAETFEAVVWGANEYGCDYSKILGKTTYADTTNPDTPTPLNWNKFTVSVDSGDLSGIKVNVDPDLSEPALPTSIYSESGGVGKLYMCVELQQHGCGGKLEFKEVLLEIEYQLDDSCTPDCYGGPDNCCSAKVMRDEVESDSVDVAAPEIKCELYGGPIFEQGDIVNVCIKYLEDNKFDDACFGEMLELNAEISGGVSGTANLLALPQNGWVPGAYAGSEINCGPDGTDLSDDDIRVCCVQFIPAATLFQQMEPGVEYKLDVEATLRSTYICGTGTRTRFLKGSQTVGRDLQDEDAIVSTVQQTFTFSTAEASANKGFFAGLVNIIIGFFAALFGFK